MGGMTIFFGIVIVVLVIMVVVSLVRGIIAFLNTTRLDLEGGDERIQEMQMRQNRMMFARIKYQAAAVIVVALMLMFSR